MLNILPSFFQSGRAVSDLFVQRRDAATTFPHEHETSKVSPSFFGVLARDTDLPQRISSAAPFDRTYRYSSNLPAMVKSPARARYPLRSLRKNSSPRASFTSHYLKTITPYL